MRAVRRLPSSTALLPGLAAGVSEVCRFSCMKLGATRTRSNAAESPKEDIFTNPVAQGRKVQ
jgi:hypothetical protein